MGKVYCYIALLFFSFGASAQSADTTKKNINTTKTDTSELRAFRSATLTPTIYKDFPLYVIDDKQIVETLSNDPLGKINPNDILKVSVFKGAEALALYGVKGANGVIIVTTKKYAKKEYQDKLASFSENYKHYLEINKNNDEGLVYTINGIVLESKQDEIIKKLYEQREKIKTVDFIEKFSAKLNTNNAKPIVVITTKK